MNPRFTRSPIIVFGMDRSGTSLVANLVSRWGAYGGDPDHLAKGNDFNPAGYFENGKLQDFLANLFNDVKVGFWDPAFPSLLEDRAAQPIWREHAGQLLDHMAAPGRPWFWKEPTLSIALPFWRSFLADCVYVIPVRDPYDSAVSYEKMWLSETLRAEISVRSANLLRWQYFLSSCLEAVESTERKIFIPYEELTADPEGQCGRLAAFLDRCYGMEGSDPDRVRQMAAAVDPGLRRNRGAVPFDERAEATAEQKALYHFLQRKVADPALAFDRALYPMYPGWREYLQALNFLGTVHMELEPALQSPVVAGAYYLHLGLSSVARRWRRWRQIPDARPAEA
jgi:hypothetical protein